jgi:hypothetical protein
MKTTTPLVIALTLVCFAFSPQTQAVNPPLTPDPGGKPISNTADGANALLSITTGLYNSGFGFDALLSNSDASFNSGIGAGALLLNNANENTAVGAGALLSNTVGTNNTAVGAFTLFANVDGHENTVVGTGSGQNLVAGFNNTYLGDFVGFLAPDESNTIRIGDLSNGNGAGSLECFIGGIFNNFQPVGGTVVEVTLDLANDKLGWDVGPNQGGGAPVQRDAPQPAARPQRQAMLNDKVEKLQATVAQQQKEIETLTAQLKEQAAQIQKVSAQIEVSKPKPRVANYKQ